MSIEISPMLIRARADGGYELDLASIQVGEPWQFPSYLNGWMGTAQYYRDAFGIVRMRGGAGGDANGHPAGPIIALPYPPGVYANWIAATSLATVALTLTDTGVLFISDALDPFEAVDLAPVIYKA